jgi:hypothetical protein
VRAYSPFDEAGELLLAIIDEALYELAFPTIVGMPCNPVKPVLNPPLNPTLDGTEWHNIARS